MNKGTFYILTLIFVVFVSAPWAGLLQHKPAPVAAVAPVAACKVQTVEVTKTEGDLTWTDIEQMCL